MARLATAVSTPSSPSYRRYLAPGEFARRFGATTAQLHAVASALEARGLPTPQVTGGRLALSLVAPAAAVERAFGTRLLTYRLPSGSTVYANDRAPTLAGVDPHAVVGIIGLDSLTSARADLQRVSALPHPTTSIPAAATASTGTPAPNPPTPNAPTPNAPTPNAQCATSITQSGAGYTAAEIAAAYGYPALYATGDTAAATTVALIEFAPFRAADVLAYAQCYAGVAPRVRAVPVDGGPGPSVAASEVETELDLEDLLGLAPHAQVLVYEGPDGAGSPTNAANYDTIAAAVDQDRAQVISTSWGECEPAVGLASAEAESALFEQAALQGQTVVAASGDSGSEDCYNASNPRGTRELAVDDPASQPFVTGAGGTELSVGASSASGTATERVWNTGSAVPNGGAGGGGLSAFWPMPAYQANAAPALGVLNRFSAMGTCRSASGHCRQVPDLAANAGSPYAIYCTQAGFGCSAAGWTPIGGTSAAAPTIAALFALADSAPACQQSGPVGFANPALYAIASGPAGATAFSDVTVGNNDFTGSNGGSYPATPGYDLASGLGTPIAGNGTDGGLVAQLCAAGARASTRVALPVPRVEAVMPPRGHAGEQVMIVGRDFGGVRSVRFGTRPARFRVAGNDRIVATVPAPAGRGPVHVTVVSAHAGSARIRADVFVYAPRPALGSLVPSSGPRRGGNVVTLTGTAFGGAFAVRFGGVPAPIVGRQGAGRLEVVAPAGTGTVEVTVVSGGGTSAPGPPARYTYAG